MHAGFLSAREASKDPRDPGFHESHVEIDLRKCHFVWPAAVLWCTVYALLARARSVECRLLVPENTGVCVYLKSLGLFEVLQKAGVEVDDRGIRAKEDTKVVLPLTHFEGEADVQRLANRAWDNLVESKLGRPDTQRVISETFSEVASNAVQHAESSIGAFGFVQFFRFSQGERFVCGVADGGIGIRKSLERNPKLSAKVPYDWSAIELAVRERISGTGDPHRGIGLYGVMEDMKQPGSQLIIHSGLGVLQISEELETEARRTVLFPGTLVYASVPT